jgi:hypothetical protein
VAEPLDRHLSLQGPALVRAHEAWRIRVKAGGRWLRGSRAPGTGSKGAYNVKSGH